ncbi:MAG: hypothetical protein R6V85_16925 [Polyangia bacterium]
MRSALAIVFISATLLPAVCGCGGDPGEILMNPWVGEGKTRILVDGIHQLEGIPNAAWDETEFRYSHSQSTSRLLRNVLRHDFRFRQVLDGELTDELLAAHDILYFNVPTAIALGSSRTDREMPRLRPGEVKAIRRFMENGGGVFVVGEHNNAYDNIEVLRPLLQPLGLEFVDAYASEPGRGRFAMDVGGYILMVRNFAEHFVTDGVRMISWSGGAPFTPESEGAIAFLSEKGFIDRGNYVTKEPVEWSNHRVDEGEYQGPDIPVAAALQVGEGRLVAIGDHNMLGTQWLGIGDNYAFGMNALQWLAGREDEPPFRNEPPIGLRFGFEQERSGWTIGRRDKHGYYAFAFNLSRQPDIFHMGMVDLKDEVDVLGFLDPDVKYPKRDLAEVDRKLAAGKRVFLLLNAADPGRGSIQLLKRYAPGLELVGPERSVRAEELKPGPNDLFPAVKGVFGRLVSSELEVNGDRIAALDHSKTGFKGRPGRRDVRPKSYDKAEPYLLNVRVRGGDPLVEAELPGGRRVSIMQRFAAGDGEIIAMVQGRIFSAHTLHCVRQEPVRTNQPAYDLEMRFMDWLLADEPPTEKQPPRPEPAGDGGPGTPDGKARADGGGAEAK